MHWTKHSKKRNKEEKNAREENEAHTQKVHIYKNHRKLHAGTFFFLHNIEKEKQSQQNWIKNFKMLGKNGNECIRDARTIYNKL